MKPFLLIFKGSASDILLYTSNQMAFVDLMLEHKDGNETDPLIEREKSWTRLDKLLLVFGVVINLGDGVEIYLPGWFKTRNFHISAGLGKRL